MEDHQHTTVVGRPVRIFPIPHDHNHNQVLQPPHPTNTATDGNNRLTKLHIIIIIVFVLGCCIGLAFMFLYRPFDSPDIQIQSLHVRSLNISDSSRLTTHWNVLFSVENHPEENSNIYYHDIQALSVFYDNQIFLPSKTEAIEPFSLGEGKTKLFEVHIDSSALYVNQTVLEDVMDELASGSLKFTLKLNAIATKAKKRRLMTVSCEDVKVRFELDDTKLWVGDLLGGPEQQCNTHMSKVR